MKQNLDVTKLLDVKTNSDINTIISIREVDDRSRLWTNNELQQGSGEARSRQQENERKREIKLDGVCMRGRKGRDTGVNEFKKKKDRDRKEREEKRRGERYCILLE